MTKKYLYNLACYAKEALTLRNNSDFITIHQHLIVCSMYIIFFLIFQCKGIPTLLLRLSKLTYYNLFSVVFCLYHVCYRLYMPMWKTIYTFEIKCVLFCSVTKYLPRQQGTVCFKYLRKVYVSYDVILDLNIFKTFNQ